MGAAGVIHTQTLEIKDPDKDEEGYYEGSLKRATIRPPGGMPRRNAALSGW